MENSESSTQPEQKPAFSDKAQGYLSVAFEFLKIIVLALIIVVPIRYYIFQPFIVKGDSMVPNFHSGDYLIVDELSWRFAQPQRGDIMVFDYPKKETERFIKRVIGLPGETVIVSKGTVQIKQKDGETLTLEEPYLPAGLKTAVDGATPIGEGEYFVMGDNREASFDSRMWGVVPQKDVIGKPIIRLWPITSLSLIGRPTY